ncbi:MAG: hypothetical protein AB7K52_03820 [Phycisphaerales bacterium]
MRHAARWSAAILLGRSPVLCVLLAGLPLGRPTACLADAPAAEPRVMVVQHDGTLMKCAAGAPFYAVRTLSAGDLLRVDGAEGAWRRVEYLTGMLAHVKAEDASLDADGKTVRLNKPSRLQAFNETPSGRGHWWNLLDDALPADTALERRETLKGMNEVVIGYLVVAPASSRGYVKAEALRPATPEETEKFIARTDVPAPVVVEATAPAAPTDSPATSAVSTAPSIAEATAPREEPKPVIYDLDTLMIRYAQTMALGDRDAERQIPVVIADFQRTESTLGQSPEDARVRTAIRRRVDALQLRRDLIAAMRKFTPTDIAAAD